ncbi:EpsG family protein [Ornithinimicrobium cryptoxanthini]|uniref:EpsG family protein n=1 Tax=Ornithinimicrobium cryptoxanthini TaxID=2934161 RepID=UPI002117F769|nr:EpsG family protein [Ornithinimicrobium cryptoxanthini]
MLPYYITIATSVVAAGLSEFQRRFDLAHGRSRGSNVARLFALVAGTALVVVAAFRWRVGTDYATYATNYESYKTQPLDWLDEPGIRILARFSAYILDDYATMFALASIITVGLTVATLYSRSRTFAFAILIYVLSTSWQGSFNGVRQFFACAVLFAGHKYVLERRLLPYLLIVLLATLFHVSALMAILLYWVPRKPMSWQATVLLLVVAAALISAYDQLGSILEWVADDDVTATTYFVEQVNPLRVLFAFFPVLVYWLFTKRQTLSDAGYFYANMLIVNAAIFMASMGSAYLARFAIYTQIYLALAIPLLTNLDNPKERRIIISLLVLAYAAFWYLETSTSANLSTFRWVTDRV